MADVVDAASSAVHMGVPATLPVRGGDACRMTVTLRTRKPFDPR